MADSTGAAPFVPPSNARCWTPGASLMEGAGPSDSWGSGDRGPMLTREDLHDEFEKQHRRLSEAVREIVREELDGHRSRGSSDGQPSVCVETIPEHVATFESAVAFPASPSSASAVRSSGVSALPQTRLRIKFQQTSPVIGESQSGPSFQRMNLQVRGLRQRFVHYVHRKGWKKTLLNILDLSVLFLINVNALIIGIQVEHAARNRGMKLPSVYRNLDYAFCAVYTFELSIRICINGWDFFSTKANIFDALVVLAQIAEIVMSFLEPSFALSSLSMLRFFRFLRALRVLRMVRYSDELLHLIYLLTASIASFAWTAVLMALLTFVIAIYITEAAADRTIYKIDIFECEEQVDLVDEYWGSLRLSTWTLFMSVFGGIDWQLAAETLPRTSTTIVFTTYVTFMSLVLLNLVTGVFVTTAEQKIDRDKQRDVERSLDNALFDADLHREGPIDSDTFRALIDHKGMKLFLRQHDVCKDQVMNVFELLQENNGPLSPQDFMSFMSRLEGYSNSLTLAQMHLSGSVDRLEMKMEMQQTMAEIRAEVTQLGLDLCGRVPSRRSPVSFAARCDSREVAQSSCREKQTL